MRHLFEPEAVEPYAYTGPRLSTDALGSAGLLTDTIAAEFGAGAVDLYLCADKPNAQRLRGAARRGPRSHSRRATLRFVIRVFYMDNPE